jgi:hypothetical protein
MPRRRTPTQVSLRGTLCRDLLDMVASGANAGEAATHLISELLNAPDSHYRIREVGGVFVFERRDAAARRDSRPTTYQ